MIFLNLKRKLFRVLNASYFQSRGISDVQKKIKNSYYFMRGDLLLSSSSIGQLVDVAADESGDHVAFISANQKISKSFSQFRHEVNKFASGLVSLGLQKGDKIAICSPNCYEWPVAQFATAKAGLILVNINPAYQAKEMEYCLKKMECKAIITWDILKTQNFYKLLCEIAPELPKSAAGKLKSHNIPSLETVIMISEDSKDGILLFNDVMNAGNSDSDKALAKLEKLIQFDDPINIQFTSGTTGFPKGATLTHHNLINNALVSGRRLGYNLLKPVICCQVPLFHCFGSVLGTLCSVIFQSTCIFPYASFNPEVSLKAIEKYKCTTVYGTPTMFVDLLNNYKLIKSSMSSLKQAVIGGAAVPEALVKEVHEVLKVPYINIAYGSTENSPVVAVNGINDDFQNAVDGVLQPLEFVELKVIDDNGCLVPIKNEGELCVRGHGLFIGYWGDKEKTEEVIDKTRWYHTGDICIMNEYGYVKIVGRKKDIVIRGGENLYPQEIENFLHTHPAVLETHVVGVPDTRMGEELCAWISVKDGMNITEEDIKKFSKGKISHFKIPRYIIFVKDFPKTTSGKIKKFEMKEISIQ
ncbi:Acyl-CoA synthetase family member 2, mitochondrial, partial [Stegodyphus mimosarum]